MPHNDNIFLRTRRKIELGQKAGREEQRYAQRGRGERAGARLGWSCIWLARLDVELLSVLSDITVPCFWCQPLLSPAQQQRDCSHLEVAASKPTTTVPIVSRPSPAPSNPLDRPNPCPREPAAAPTTVADTAKPWVADCVALARNNRGFSGCACGLKALLAVCEVARRTVSMLARV